MSARSVTAALVALTVASACATTSGTATPQGPARDKLVTGAAHRAAVNVDPRAITLPDVNFAASDFTYVDGKTGQVLSFDDVLARAKAAQVVMVAEQHDQAAHHELQRRVVSALAQDTPGLAVGMEMFTWDKQPALDRFNSGALDPKGLAGAVDWQKSWGFPFTLYEPILADGHKLGARFVAINAPRDLVRGARKRGIEGLSAEELATLPAIDLEDTQHRAWFENIFKGGGHPMTQKDLDGFYLAQVVWDESMAEHTVRALDAGAPKVVVLCGVGHVAAGRGVPQRIERRKPDAKVLSIVPLAKATSADVRELLMAAIVLGEGDIIAVPKIEEGLDV